MKRYKVTDQAKAESKEYEGRVLEKIKSYGPNYTNLAIQGRYSTGYLGEWGFKQFLDEFDIEHHWLCDADGFSDDADFIINGKSIDVKNTNYPEYQEMLLPVAQLNKKQKDVYVSAGMKMGFIELYGFVFLDQVLVAPFKVARIKNRVIKNSDMHQIEEFGRVMNNLKE